MDHMMPDLDGIETAKLIRALPDEYFQTVPIVALTANAISGMKEMFLSNEMDDFLAKPIEIAKLHAVLQKWIPGNKRGKALAAASMQNDGTSGIELEGLDVAQGIARMGGFREGYVKTLGFFHEDALSRIDLMASALEKGDIKAFTIYIHGIKSACGNIGAVALSELAARLEAAGIRNDTDFIRTHFEIFADKTRDLLAVLDVFLRREQAGDAAVVAGDDDVALLLLELPKLRIALGKFDAGAIEKALATLQSGVAGTENRHALDEIAQHVLLFQYDAAMAIIDALSASCSDHGLRDRRMHDRRKSERRTEETHGQQEQRVGDRRSLDRRAEKK
ncbi:MAG: response regulator, partial [Deltaproteobacteria bacterium]|jgi:CheY-like chemotaxis protein|nr:response regulator [Deltaproteobacteria bacterium]